MYASAWPGLNPALLFKKQHRELPFPLDAPRRSPFHVARNGIYHLFRALRLRKDEFVLVPDYHHGNEIWAIRAAGAPLRFYRIDRNLKPDLDQLRRLSKSGARVLYVTHFMGWPQPLKDLLELARERGMVLVEDCALSLLTNVEGVPVGSFGDYAIFCLYKTLPVPNGGLLVSNNSALPELDRIRPVKSPALSVAGRSTELVLEWVRNRADRVGGLLASLKRMAGQSLNRCRVQRVSVGDTGFNIANVNFGMSEISENLLTQFDYSWIYRKRRENFRLMLEKLRNRASLLTMPLDEGVCPLFFPILVSDKSSAARALWRRGIGAVEFWNYGDDEAAAGASENAGFLRRHVLELPVHQDLTPSHIEYIAEQVTNLDLHL